MRILALDLATSTGWAAWDGRLIASGKQSFPLRRGESPGMRLLRFRTWIRGVIADLQPEVIAWEAPLAKGSGMARGGLTGEALAALVLVEAEGVRAQTTTIYPATLKKHATGKGNAPKAAMVSAARERWGVEPESHDHADALCVLGWVLEEIGEVTS